MVISVSKKIWLASLQGDNEAFILIKYILNWVESGKHSLIFESGIDPELILEEPKFSSYSETIQSIVKEQFYNPVYTQIIRITDTTSLSDEGREQYYGGRLKVEIKEDGEVIRYINSADFEEYLEKLYIVMENVESDRAFLDSIALNKIELFNSKKVQFINGGGGTTLSVINQLTNKPKRVICIIDSDKEYPTHNVWRDSKNRDLKRLCNQKNIELIMLDRREIENYIPLEILKLWLSMERPDINTDEHPYFEFSREQRYYFDLKKGLKKMHFNNENIKNLYINFEESANEICQNHSECISNNPCNICDKEQIINGFGAKVWNAFKLTNDGENSCYEECEVEINSIINTIENFI